MSDFINEIKINDYLKVGLVVSGGGTELITNVTSALDATTGKTKYTVTTANRTLIMFHHQFQPSGVLANSSATGPTTWVVSQLE